MLKLAHWYVALKLAHWYVATVVYNKVGVDQFRSASVCDKVIALVVVSKTAAGRSILVIESCQRVRR